MRTPVRAYAEPMHLRLRRPLCGSRLVALLRYAAAVTLSRCVSGARRACGCVRLRRGDSRRTLRSARGQPPGADHWQQHLGFRPQRRHHLRDAADHRRRHGDQRQAVLEQLSREPGHSVPARHGAQSGFRAVGENRPLPDRRGRLLCLPAGGRYPVRRAGSAQWTARRSPADRPCYRLRHARAGRRHKAQGAGKPHRREYREGARLRDHIGQEIELNDRDEAPKAHAPHRHPGRIVMRMRLALLMLLIGGAATTAQADIARIERLVAREIHTILPTDGIGGAAVAVRIDGRTAFFNYGSADMAQGRPITLDSVFNIASLRKVFEATLLAQAVQQGELALDDPVARHVVELQHAGYLRGITVGQLAIHTSGLLLPQDHEPWPDWGYTLPEFIRTLQA